MLCLPAVTLGTRDRLTPPREQRGQWGPSYTAGCVSWWPCVERAESAQGAGIFDAFLGRPDALLMDVLQNLNAELRGGE